METRVNPGRVIRSGAAARLCLILAALTASAVMPAAGSEGQRRVPRPAPRAAPAGKLEKWRLSGRVATPHGEPIRGADVRADINTASGAGRTVETNSQGEFGLDFELDRARDQRINVKLTATKDGYLDAREILEFEPPGEGRQVDMVLREDAPHTRQLPLETLVSGLLAPLHVPAAPIGTAMAEYEEAQRIIERGYSDDVVELLLGVVRRNPECVECRTMLGLALVDGGGWWGATRQFTEAARLMASPGAPNDKDRRSEPFLALGVLATWRGRLRQAEGFFLRALEIDPVNPLTLQELGRVFVLERNMKAADIYLAAAAKRGAGAEAHVLRAQALLEEGQPSNADAEMAAFLGKRKVKDLPEAFRGQWSEMKERVAIESRGKGTTVVDEPLSGLERDYPAELQGLQPASNQDQLPLILRKLGASVEAFFHNFSATTSIEDIEMQRLHPDGKVAASAEQQFHYIVVTDAGRATLGFHEYRTDQRGAQVWEAGKGRFMVTQGFASACAYFHPQYQRGAAFRYLGKQKLDGHDTDVIAFAQRPETAQVLESFDMNGTSTVVLVQGLAWVDAAHSEILRMRTDLLKPQPRFRLAHQATDIRFAETRFKGASVAMWLPSEVAVTVDWNGRIYRNQHSYSDYQLFGVETKQKLKAPKVPAGRGAN